MNKLKVINFKSIAVLEIEPAGKSFTLEGRNGAGKTAVIDAIRWALQGNAWISEDVIKQGQNEVKVLYEDDTLSITRSMKRGKAATIKVTDKAGVIAKTPQALLDTLVTNLSFDPTDFLELKPADQVNALRELVDPKGEIAKLESEKATVYDNRTIAGREMKRLQGAFDTLPYHKDAPLEEVSSQELVKAFEDAKATRDRFENLNESYTRVIEFISDKEDEISALEKELEDARKDLSGMMETKATTYHAIANFGELPDLAVCKLAFDEADETNKKVRANAERRKAQEALNLATHEHDILDKRHEKLVKEIDTTIKQSELPVDGLAFDADGITLDGKRFSECSDGERLEAALKISMALNKGLKMIAIRNGSLLDADKQAAVMAFAREHGYQVIMEIVGTGDISVEIEQEVEA